LIEHGKSGFLIGASDLTGFVDMVVNLLNDDAKRKAVASTARQRAQELFDVRRNTRQTQEVYVGDGKN